MGLHSEIDFRNASDTGEPDGAAIIPYTNGEPAHQTTFRRPTENNRSRTDAIRSLLRELVVLSDLDRNGLVLTGGGTVTFNGAKATYTGQFTLGADLVVMPLATPGGGASAPFLQSTKAWVKAGTPGGTDELVFTSKYRQWEDTATDPDIAKEANKISVEIQDTGSLSVAVNGATGEENNILVGIDYNTTTCQQVIDAVNAHTDANKLVLATLGASGIGATVSPKFSEAEWSTDYSARFLQGGAAGTYHLITNANLANFWTADVENPLEKGDTLAIWYDKLVELSTDDGRFQSTPENALAPTIPSGSLFNTRREPEKIPNCIPICKCLDDDTLLFANGARVSRTVPSTLLSGGAATLDTTGWTRMHAFPGAHTPPTTLQQGLNNADDLIEAALTEVEAARSSTVYGAQASVDARIELADGEINTARNSSIFGAKASLDARIEAVDQHARVYVSVDQPAGTAGLYATLPAAITALEAANGGTIYLRAGTYTLTTPQTLSKNTRIIGVEDGVIIANNLNSSLVEFTVNASCLFENITFSAGAASSERTFQFNAAGRTRLRQCAIAGSSLVTHASADVAFDECTLSPETGATSYFDTLSVTSGKATLRNCALSGNSVSASRLITVNDAVAATVICYDCTLTAVDTMYGILATATGGGVATVKLVRCAMTGEPYTAGRALFGGSGVLDLSLVDTTLELTGAGTPLVSPVIGLTAATSRLDIRNLRVNMADKVLGHSAHNNAPFYLIGTTHVDGLHFEGVHFTDISGSLATGMHLINVNPAAGNEIVMRDVTFKDFSSDTAANTANMALIGQDSAQTGDGTVHLQGVHCYVGSLSYGSMTNLLRYIQLNSTSLGHASIRDCTVVGGAWGGVAYTVKGVTLEVINNTFTSGSADGSAFNVSGTAGSGYAVVANNIVRDTEIAPTLNTQSILVDNVRRAVVQGNTVHMLATTPTTDIRIGTGVVAATVFGNITTNAVSNAATGDPQTGLNALA